MDPMMLIGFVVVAAVLVVVALFFTGVISLAGRGTADPAAPVPDRSMRRVLVLLTTDCVDDDVCRRVAGGALPVEVRVAVPPLAGHVDYYLAGDDREALPVAERRLADALTALDSHGVNGSGVVGDLSASATQLVADEVGGYGPDEIVLVVHPDAEQHWAEHHLVRDAPQRFAVPITIVRSFDQASPEPATS